MSPLEHRFTQIEDKKLTRNVLKESIDFFANFLRAFEISEVPAFSQ